MRRIAVVGMIILGLVAVPLIAAAKPAPEKVEICHVTGNGGAHVIEVSTKAMQKHLDHGDTTIDDDNPAEDCGVESPAGDTELPNQAPTARIDVNLVCTDSIFAPVCRYELDGTDSSDPEGSALIYFWTVSNAIQPLTSATIYVNPPTTIPVTATLIVSDGELSSEPASVTIPTP